MSVLSRTVFLLVLLVLGCLLPVRAQTAHPATRPDVRIDSIDIFWRRAEQKYIHFNFHIFNTGVDNLSSPLDVRLNIRASPQEGWRPIKVWHLDNFGGHEMRELVYQPGVISDPVLFTGHFQVRLDVSYHDVLLDSQTQSYP